jgi:hypothetical protein
MAWTGPSGSKPVWCASTGQAGPTAGAVTCTTDDPTKASPELAMMQSGAQMQPHPATGEGQTVSDVPSGIVMPASYQKFTRQDDLGKYLMAQYHIRSANELSSCETCHR